MRSTTTLSLALLLLAGCSLLNSPDRDRIADDDGGIDMEVADAGIDVDVPTDVFDAGPLVEICDQVGDEDNDGLSDCADFDCVGAARCCDDGEPTNIGFEDGFPTWTSIGTPRVEGTRVVFPGTTPSTYVNNSCFPLARGGVFLFDVHQNPAIDCVDGACTDFAAVFLTSVRTAPLGIRIVAEIGVTVYANGRVELYRGRNNIIETTSITLQAETRIEVRITPDIFEGEAVLRAEVTVGGVTLSETPLIAQSDLISGCRDGISGLYFGVEGQGQRLPLDSEASSAATFECTNPTQFTTSGRSPVTGELLLWDGDWSTGDITHPELVRDDRDWHVFGSTASQQLEFSYLPDFPWAMAKSSVTDWNEDSEWFFGGHTPTVREPTVALGASGESLIQFGVVDDEIYNCTGTCARTGIQCDSLANPSLVLTPQNNFLLFYQCGSGAETEVYVRALTTFGTPSMTYESTVVLRASDFGGLARNAIVDFDVLLDERGGADNPEYLIRAWFVVEALGNIRTLALATASVEMSPADPDAMEELRALGPGLTLIPYAANPVANEDVLFHDAAQTLQGVSVERNESQRDLIFLFGRRTERAEGRLYDFVPIEQVWGLL